MFNLVQRLIIERVKQLPIQFCLLIAYSSNLATHIIEAIFTNIMIEL